MILYSILFGVIASLSAGLGGYLYGVDVGRDKQIAEQAKIEAVAQLAAEKVADKSAQAISNLQVKETTIYQKATHEIRTNTVYADCRHTPGVLESVNEALTGKRPSPASGGKLPPTAPAQRSDIRLDNGKTNRLGFPVPTLQKSDRPS